jgi:hypothetical protein
MKTSSWPKILLQNLLDFSQCELRVAVGRSGLPWPGEASPLGRRAALGDDRRVAVTPASSRVLRVGDVQRDNRTSLTQIRHNTKGIMS